MERDNEVTCVCLPLGSHRSLKGIVATLFATHPDCLALNSQPCFLDSLLYSDVAEFGFVRDRSRLEHLRWMWSGSTDDFEHFVRVAVDLSDREGSITRNQNFCIVKDVWPEVEGSRRPIKTILVRDYRFHNIIVDCSISVGELLRSLPKLKFYFVVRNVIDTATSCYQKRLNNYSCFPEFRDREEASLPDVIDAVMTKVLFAVRLEERHPDRIFHVSQYDIGQKLVPFTKFLGLEPEGHWTDLFMDHWNFSGEKHQQPQNLVDQVSDRLREANRLKLLPELLGIEA